MSDERALHFTRTAEKELRRLDPPIRARVMGALDRLGAMIARSMSSGSRGSEHFRLRVDDWRVIFAMQCYQPVWRVEEIVAVLRGAVDEMVGLADSHLAESDFTSTERDTFIARAQRGVEDGLKAGSDARSIVSFEQATPALFLPYR